MTTILIVVACSTVWIPLALPIAGLNVRASQIVLLPCLLLLVSQSSWRITVLGAAEVVLGAVFIGALLFWTMWWRDTLPVAAGGRVVLHALNLLHWAVLQSLLWRTRDVRGAALTLIVTVAGFNAFYVFVALLAAAGIFLPVEILVESSQPALVAGEIVSQSLLRFDRGGVAASCLSAAALVMLFAMLADQRERRPKQPLLTSVLLGAGLVLGTSRQSVVSLAVGMVVVVGGFALRGYFSRILRVSVRLVAVAVIAGALLIALPATRGYVSGFAGRAGLLLSGGSYSSGTAGERIGMWSGMWADIAANPFMGRGQDAYLKHFPLTDPAVVGTGGGAHSFPFEIWHAGGLFAILAMLALHGLAFGPAVTGLIVGRREDLALFIALVAGGAALVAATLTNLIYWSPTYWLLLAMISSAHVLRLNPLTRPGARPIG